MSEPREIRDGIDRFLFHLDVFEAEARAHAAAESTAAEAGPVLRAGVSRSKKLPDFARQHQDDSPVLRRAIDWAQQGWPVFPLRPGDKIPCSQTLTRTRRTTRASPSSATDDVGWSAWSAGRDPRPRQDPQMVERQPSSRDRRVHRRPSGFRLRHPAWGRPQRRVPAQPRTPVRAWQRQLPLDFTVSAAIWLAKSSLARASWGPGIDIRAGEGSYVVLPESTHPESGQPYTVMNPDVPEHALTDDEVRAIWAAYGVRCRGSGRPSTRSPGTALP